MELLSFLFLLLSFALLACGMYMHGKSDGFHGTIDMLKQSSSPDAKANSQFVADWVAKNFPTTFIAWVAAGAKGCLNVFIPRK